mgnify:CR=1 FL=1
MEKNLATAESFFVRIKNKICLTLGIDTYQLSNLIDRYLLIHYPEYDSVTRRAKRTNILSEFTAKKMTVKVFFRFLRILNLKKVRFSITLTTSRDREYTVTEDLYFLNDEIDEKEFEDEKTNL